MTAGKDDVLSMPDEAIERLGLQHRVWRPRVTDAWRRAGFTTGQTRLDLGRIDATRGLAIRDAHHPSQSTPGAFQLMPTVLEIIAPKR